MSAGDIRIEEFEDLRIRDFGTSGFDFQISTFKSSNPQILKSSNLMLHFAAGSVAMLAGW
jgi:hypothetical protein